MEDHRQVTDAAVHVNLGSASTRLMVAVDSQRDFTARSGEDNGCRVDPFLLPDNPLPPIPLSNELLEGIGRPAHGGDENDRSGQTSERSSRDAKLRYREQQQPGSERDRAKHDERRAAAHLRQKDKTRGDGTENGAREID